MEYSPITALNRAFAIGKVNGSRAGIQEVRKLNLQEVNYYHALLGYLYTEVDVEKAMAHYNKAIELTDSISEKNTLLQAIERLNQL